MAQHILYAYVEGFDLEGVADDLERRFTEFVGSRPWVCPHVWVVNHRHPRDDSLKPGDLPAWDLGLHVELPDPHREPKGWFKDIEAIATFLATLRPGTGRDFVIGIIDTVRGFDEDLFFVDSDAPDLGELRAIIGVKDSE